MVTGLDRTDPVTAVTAMGGIITEARSNPAFVLLLAVTAVLALVVGVLAARRLRQPGGTILLAGAGFTLLAGIVTLVFNVPLNTRLNTNDPRHSHLPMPHGNGRRTSSRGCCGTPSVVSPVWWARRSSASACGG